MDILIYVLLALILALGAGIAILLLRRSDTRAQGALADTVQRVEHSLREQERALATLVHERLAKSEETTGRIVTDLRERLGKIDRKSTRLNSSHVSESRMPSSA